MWDLQGQDLLNNLDDKLRRRLSTKLDDYNLFLKKMRYHVHLKNNSGKVTRSCSGVPTATVHTCMFGVMILPTPSMSHCECDCLWDASQCVSYALLSSIRYNTYPFWLRNSCCPLHYLGIHSTYYSSTLQYFCT